VIPPVARGMGAAGDRALAGGRVRRFVGEMADGFTYLWHGQRMLFFMLCTFALVNFAMTPIGPLLPFVAEQRLGLDAAGAGCLPSRLAGGAAGGAVGMSVAGARVRRGIAVVWSPVVVGVALLAVGGLAVVAPVVAAFVVVGVALSVANVC